MAIIRLHRVQIWWTTELPSNNLGVYAVKTRNFCRDSAAIWWRSLFILAFRNGLEYRNFDFISVHLVEIWWDSDQWLRSLRHKKLYSRRRKFFGVTSGSSEGAGLLGTAAISNCVSLAFARGRHYGAKRAICWALPLISCLFIVYYSSWRMKIYMVRQ